MSPIQTFYGNLVSKELNELNQSYREGVLRQIDGLSGKEEALVLKECEQAEGFERSRGNDRYEEMVDNDLAFN